MNCLLKSLAHFSCLKKKIGKLYILNTSPVLVVYSANNLLLCCLLFIVFSDGPKFSVLMKLSLLTSSFVGSPFHLTYYPLEAFLLFSL